MEFEFYKLRVCGNDLILVNYLDREPPEPSVLSPLSKRLCDRVRGVGGSGVIFLVSQSDGRFNLRHYLSSGEESSVYPDALVCACRYLFDSGHTGTDIIQFIEAGTPKDVRVVDSNHFTVRLGEPLRFDGSVIREENAGELTTNLTVACKTLVITPVVQVRPSAVIFLGDERTGSLRNLSQLLSRTISSSTPAVQPVFVRVYDRDDMRVYLYFNRRVKDYLSCAGAAAVASVMNGFCDRQVLARAGRNDLYIQWNVKTNEVSVTASAAYSFSGYFYYEHREGRR